MFAIVTGAAGFLGRHVAKEFCEAGIQVSGIGHGILSAEERRVWGIPEWHTNDVTVESLCCLNRLPDIFVHCAGGSAVGPSMTNPFLDFQRSVATTAAVLEYLRLKAPAARLVYISSAAVYGNTPVTPIREDATLCPLSPYGIHKMVSEQLCKSYAHNFGIGVTVLRLFSIYGPCLRKQLLWDACRKLRNPDAVFGGTGGEIRDWLHVRDAARLIRVAAQSPEAAGAVINGGAGRGVAVRDILQCLRERLGSKACLSFDGNSRPGDPVSLVASIEVARGLGWDPATSLEEGLEEYAQWFLEGANIEQS